MAKAIGTRVASSGHILTIYNRTPEKSMEVAKKLGAKVLGKSLAEVGDEEVMIFALPYTAISEVWEKYGQQLAGKVLVDISNPVNFQTFELIPPAGTSGAEELAKKLPKGSILVKAFNTTFAGTLVMGSIDGKQLDVFVASDDKTARELVIKLASECGLRGLDAGPLKNARHLEGFQLVHMMLQQQMNSGWMSTIKILV